MLLLCLLLLCCCGDAASENDQDAGDARSAEARSAEEERAREDDDDEHGEEGDDVDAADAADADDDDAVRCVEIGVDGDFGRRLLIGSCSSALSKKDDEIDADGDASSKQEVFLLSSWSWSKVHPIVSSSVIEWSLGYG
eukprot:3829785-Rhodomonas_salina.3